MRRRTGRVLAIWAAICFVLLSATTTGARDVNGDFDLDAVFADAGQRNQVCLGNGFGSLLCGDLSIDSNFSSAFALGDIDANGHVDVVFGNTGERNRVCLGTGTGVFACSDVSTDTNNSVAVALGDVDGDHDLDAVFANVVQRNRVCYGTGTGTFVCADISSDINGTQDVALGDVDGDLDLDAVFANDNARGRVCYGTGTGLFTCADVSADTNNTRGVALGDVDGDHDLDAVFANLNENRVCYGTGTGLFACADVSADTNDTRGVALGDVDGDHDLDAVFANLNERNRVCYGSGTGLFACADVDTDMNSSLGVALATSVVDRLSGMDRYATAAAVSESRFSPGVDVAYVATGLNFPDALAAGPAAALDRAPILLVTSISIPTATATELNRLDPDRIVIVGGTAAVSAGVETQLGTYGPVERLWGPDRYGTAAAISQSRFSSGVHVAYIATGLNFPDALAGAPVAALNGGPILLVQPNSIPPSTATELTRLNPAKIVILGGTGAVSAAVETQLETYGPVERLWGPDRYGTAAAISQSRFAQGVPVAYIATGLNFPDALAAAPVVYLDDGPILLTQPTSIPPATASELTRLRAAKIVILGGTGAVSAAVETQLHTHTAP